METEVYSVRGYSTGPSPETHRSDVLSLDRALLIAARLKSQGFFVEIRDAEGNLIPEEPLQ
jgi:hypothetical protein